MGLAHDLGKCTDAFQKRLLEGGPVVDHTTAGMLTCIKMKRPSAAACAAGHHGGLLDVGNLRTDRAGEATLSGRFKKGVEGHYLERCGESGVTLPTLPPETPERNPLKASFRTRMLYSCLVDADFLDTERFMDGERGRGGYDDPSDAAKAAGRIHRAVAGTENSAQQAALQNSKQLSGYRQ